MGLAHRLLNFFTFLSPMNKAFLREPDQEDSRCPGCGNVGIDVGALTLNAQLSETLRHRFSDTAAFCRAESCPVVYFDDFGARVDQSEIGRPIPFKDVDAPLCGCFGFTRDEIEQDLAEGSFARVRAALNKAESTEARCSTQSPHGRSCVAEIQGYYVRCKQRLDQ